ncbi:MAG TPA: ROK family protein [Thermoclostridium sp.]
MKIMFNSSDCILAVDAGGTFLKAALVSANGNIIENTLFKIPVDSNGSLQSISDSYSLLASVGLEKASRENLRIKGVGVCIPGPFDYLGGQSLMKHKYATIYGVPMRPWFETVIGNVPITFLHDSTAFILGATVKSKYKKYRKIGAVIIGTGLGFATMIDSKVLTNPAGGPGVSIYSRQYRDGIAEDYVSRRGIISQYKNLCPDSPTDIDVIEIANLACSGNTAAITVFTRTGLYLAEILHDVLQHNDYQCLLLGGAISKSSDLFINPLKQGLSDITTLELIEQADNIDIAPILGTAQAVLRQSPAL